MTASVGREVGTKTKILGLVGLTALTASGESNFPYSSPLNFSNSSKWDWHTNHNLMSFNARSLPPTDIIVNLRRHDNSFLKFLSFDVFQLYHTSPLRVIVERRRLVKNDFK